MEELAAGFESGGREFQPVLRRMFLSREFQAPEVVRTQIKSPVQWLSMALRQLERPVPRAEQVQGALRELGQELLAPPNVKGWDGGPAWINTATLTRRQQYAALLLLAREEGEAAPGMIEGGRGERWRERLRRNPAGGPGGPGPGPRPGSGFRRGGGGAVGGAVGGGGPDPTRLFASEELKDRKRLMTALERRFLQAKFRPALEADVREALGDDPVPDPRAVVDAIRVVMQSTDYQLA